MRSLKHSMKLIFSYYRFGAFHRNDSKLRIDIALNLHSSNRIGVHGNAGQRTYLRYFAETHFG